MYEKDARPVVATDADYALGRHYRWEVAAHEAENEFFKSTGRYWDYDFRKRWLARFFSITPIRTQQEVVTCSVCSESISKDKLEGRNPFAAPASFKEELKVLTRRVGNVLAAKKVPATTRF